MLQATPLAEEIEVVVLQVPPRTTLNPAEALIDEMLSGDKVKFIMLTILLALVVLITTLPKLSADAVNATG